MSLDRSLFLHLVSVGALNANPSAYRFPNEEVDWGAVITESRRQGVYAIVLDGYQRMLDSDCVPSDKLMPRLTLLNYGGNVISNYENRYLKYADAISSLAGFYREHGLKMMVVKGYSCSLDWPKPDHRPCGDIDIWMFGKYKEADQAISAEKGVQIDTSEHHHTSFSCKGFLVENHYDFVNVHAHRSSAKIEKVFKELAEDDSFFTMVNGEKVYLPSPSLNSLFLLRHTMAHFTGAGIHLRQILDWAFFVEKNTSTLDWDWFLKMIDRFGMRGFFSCLCAICVEDLGFSRDFFPEFSFDPSVKRRILEDTFNPPFPGRSPQKKLPRIIFKMRRYRANSWKRKLCYPDEGLFSMMQLAWSHIMGPEMEE